MVSLYDLSMEQLKSLHDLVAGFPWDIQETSPLLNWSSRQALVYGEGATESRNTGRLGSWATLEAGGDSLGSVIGM